MALQGISFTLDSGRTLAVVGPSGSGKSTLARCLAGLEKPTGGEICFLGRPIEIQLIFQQPAASLNPRFTVVQIVEEPLVIQRRGTATERRRRARLALERVGLSGEILDLPSHYLSGGEKQRLAIARALVVEPKLLILDESLTGVDADLQAQIVAVLREARERLQIAYIMIAHDLEMAATLADEIAVLDRGSLIESAQAADILAAPRHPVTRELVSATKALAV
jgi:ABC-type dipeptide/oligopeptide/nickel transport system ATPase subunit